MADLIVRKLNCQDYLPTWEAMKAFTNSRKEETVDEVWLLEHPPVFTQGQAGKEEHILNAEAIPIVRTDRGGQVTFHGPGQLVMYVLFDLKRLKIGIRQLVTRLEATVIQLLAEYGISATSRSEAPGVYVQDAKICSIGLRIRRGCSYHGIAFNIDMDLAPFKRINPCGFSNLSITQVKNLYPQVTFQEIESKIVHHLLNNFGYNQPIFATSTNHLPPEATKKQRAADKLARIPIKIEATDFTKRIPLPPWIRVSLPTHNKIAELKSLLRQNRMVTVCEEASCPNLLECFGHGIATFMIMGDKCTRRCTFCDVGHGRPDPLDPLEPINLATTIKTMGLKYVVITSVDRDDLRDGGASHFAKCIAKVREENPTIKIEVLVPDFRGRMRSALDELAKSIPDVFNHNTETVPRLYKQVRPGSDYLWSLKLLEAFKSLFPTIPTKSGLMLGLGETNEEIIEVMRDLRAHQVDMLTLGQYLQPSQYHSPVTRYVSPEEFHELGKVAKEMGFTNVASGPLVRSSYHADRQAAGEMVD
jgi:lipoic acid synthetase